MKMKHMLCGLSLLLATVAASATPVLVVGQPGNSLLATPTGPTPGGSLLANFDSLTPFSTYSTYTSKGISISSPNGLEVLPYSTQSGPNELFDEGANGTADITISLTSGATSLGVGIADSDPVTVTLQALGKGGVDLGSPFVVDLASTESVINYGNGYYVIEDSTSDIYGLEIIQNSGSSSYSGLAIDDVTVTPEPSSAVLMMSGLIGLACLGSFQMLKKA